MPIADISPIWGVAVGLCVVVGAVVSYSIQGRRIYMLRSVDGMALWSILLNVVAAELSVVATMSGVHDCVEMLREGLFADALLAMWPLALRLTEFAMLALIAAEYVWVSRRRADVAKVIAVVALLPAAFLALTAGAALGALTRWRVDLVYDTDGVYILAGIASAAVGCWVWVPQIMHTYHVQRVGALSQPMLWLQAIGGCIVTSYLIVLTDAAWYVWGSSLVNAMLVAALLTLTYVHVERLIAATNSIAPGIDNVPPDEELGDDISLGLGLDLGSDPDTSIDLNILDAGFSERPAAFNIKND